MSFIPVTDPALQRPLRRIEPTPERSYLVHASSGEVWRRLRVPSSVGMERFARILQLAFEINSAEHTFIQQDGNVENAPVIMPAQTLVRFDAAGTPSETVTLSEVLPVADLHFLSNFGEPTDIKITLVGASEQLPAVETLCIDGSGSLGNLSFSLAAINRELDAERWVFAKLSLVKEGLRDLIFRTGMWETAQLVAYLDTEQEVAVSAEEAAVMVGPVLADAHLSQLLELHRVEADPLAQWRHIAHKLPLERDTRGNDAAWLRIIALISAMPYGAETFLLEGMQWAGHPTTLAEVDKLTANTMRVLSLLGVVDGDTLVLGGPLSKPHREFLRMILRGSQ
ncbi:IS1096 element passenger TnpR family protein [Corynebacterium epidermidicanis]|uniref:Plasmid pRiA4b ORF-3-like protein n=1 Tax=Corynebacterium epidermidicanis TaxID=1050174 RepID=A0A0G3GNE5_9CORY|nr:hypothetical protein [Corynebacterium epidermidicanis]AKK02095.1 Plasmid pRiA4b ORF-3-like protein [Corynebacterium epidermidicanis]